MLSWVHPSWGETGFRIERKSGSHGYLVHATLPAGPASCTDVAPEPGVRYTFRVLAVNGRGRTLPSNEVNAEVPFVPAAPEDLSATLESGVVRLTWAAHSDLELGFSLARRVGAGSFGVLRVLPPNTTSYRDVRVRPGVQHTYRVRATHPLGPSPSSNEASATPPP